MRTFFVVRDTDHPAEDLERNFSSVMGGFDHEVFMGRTFATEEELRQAYIDAFGEDYRTPKLRYHPAHESFVPVHYEGLGAFQLQSDTLEDALIEANEYEDDLACTSEMGDGHFYSYQVVSYHKVREGRFVFELKAY